MAKVLGQQLLTVSVFMVGLLLGGLLNSAKTVSLVYNDIRVDSSLDAPQIPWTLNAPPNSSVWPHRLVKYNSTLQFVFTVGLEGTGHHFMGSIATNSPHVRILEEWKILPNELSKFQLTLHDQDHPSAALFSAHCTRNKPDVTNVSALQQQLVQQLQHMERMAQSSANNNSNHRFTHIRVPINTFKNKGFGMNSYPNFAGPCRKLNAPSLNLLYTLCDMAQVDCGHVLIHRDPYAVLQSTMIHRKYNKGQFLPALRLYTNHLNLMAAEMHAFSQQCWGCFGLLEASTATVINDGNNNDERPPWWDELRQLWGWNSPEVFDAYMAVTYQAPKSMKQRSFVPKRLEPYLREMYDAYHRTIRICQESHAGHLKPAR